ncbi:hypothetical protein K2X30_12735 [bacterium]|jgi:hypothetical protein|nr:hypothetical protein [bacterium]
MPGKILVISQRSDDTAQGKYLGDACGLEFYSAKTLEEIRNVLTQNPQTVVWWNIDDAKEAIEIGNTLNEIKFPKTRVFAVGKNPLDAKHPVFKLKAFAHFIRRRYQGQAVLELYPRLVTAAMTPSPFGIERYFPTDSPPKKKMQMTKMAQRRPLVQAIQNHLCGKNTPIRLATTVARVADEILLNALFSAPVLPDDTRYRATMDRTQELDLNQKEIVTIELSTCDRYRGICVTDNFGALRMKDFIDAFERDYDEADYFDSRPAHSAGVGLYQSMISGMSLIFISKHHAKTEVHMLFPICKSFREFRDSFRFISVMVPD